MRIEANLPANLWPEIVKAAGYTANRTLVRKLGWKTPFEAVKKQKPRFAHMHVYGCRAYSLDHHIPRKKKLEPRAHIGYLVGYDSTNIYRIWIPSRNKVIRTRDVTMNDNLLYHPSDLDIGAVLREQADQLIETLDIPEIEELLEDESEDLLDTVPALWDSTGISTPNSTELENLLEEQLHVTNSQLPTPSPTPSDESTHSLLTLSNDTKDGALPAAPGNRAHRGNEISGNFDPQNIIQGSRTRRSAYVAALGQTDKLVGYYASFSTAVKAGGMTKPPH